MEKNIRIQIQVGKGGIIIDEHTTYAKDIDDTAYMLAGVVRRFRATGANLLSMQVEILKEWERR